MLIKEIFYIPNILEYIRILLLFYSIIYKNFIYFILNYILDIVDGPVARYLNQTSDLGCFLDHFVDRLTVCIPAILLLYNNYFDLTIVFTVVESFTNIYFNFFVTKKHMKHNENKNWLIKTYYSNNRHNIISYASLVPYFLYAPLIYCMDIPIYLLYLLRAGVFLYFLIYTQKLKFWLK
jgi:phosphatidylglycerophosphate synthase